MEQEEDNMVFEDPFTKAYSQTSEVQVDEQVEYEMVEKPNGR